MYDGFKLELPKHYKDLLLKNEYLEFKTVVDTNGVITKEFASYPTGAYSHLLYFEIKNNYIEVKGSFHKYFENGTNCNRYTFSDFKATLIELEQKFGIGADAIIHNIEFGLNINLGNDYATDVIKTCMLYKCYEFNTELYCNGTKGIMKNCVRNQYEIKIYDKGLQQNGTQNLLRIERKFKKMQRLGSQITLATLLQPDFIANISNQLLDAWNDVILYEPNIDKEKLSLPMQKIYTNWSNPNYLIGLLKTSKRKFKYERSKFKELINQKCKKSTHNKILELMFEQLCEIEKLVPKLPLV